MIEFVNAKINIGLQIVNRRENGYHDLQTVFYPVGRFAGTPLNPEPFCDILEIEKTDGGIITEFSGKTLDCDSESNIVTKAARLYLHKSGLSGGVRIRLEKHLPFGAGMGGGSADGAFTLLSMDRIIGCNDTPDRVRLASMALELGADCPFFIYNRPMYGEGLGEILSPMDPILDGYVAVVVKPDVFVSTKEAFAGIRPRKADFDLLKLPEIPIEEWQGLVKNDFEKSIFPRHPELAEIKEKLLRMGALYASMSGSGSSIYGIFRDRTLAEETRNEFSYDPTIEHSYLLVL